MKSKEMPSPIMKANDGEKNATGKMYPQLQLYDPIFTTELLLNRRQEIIAFKDINTDRRHLITGL